MFIAAVWKGRDSHADKAKFSSLAHRFLGEGANIWFPTPAIALAQASASRTDFHGAPSCVATGAIFAIDDGGTFDRNQQALFSELYRSRGAQFVESINGQFACAIANAADGSLFIARDHIGIEPLYYSDNAELTVVSSFAPAVAAFNHQADSGFDETTIARFLCFNYNPGHSTFWRGVQKFQPGHYAEITDGKFRLTRYWRPSYADQLRDDENTIVDKLRDSMQSAISIRGAGIESPGVFVSGGLDSSTVLGVLAQHSDNPLRTFSYRCRGQGFDESHYARLMAQSVGSEHAEVEYLPENVNLMVDLVGEMSEPFCDVGINIATGLLGREAIKSTNYVLTGDGGDECFGGHPIYEADKVARYTDLLPTTIMRSVGNVLTKLPDSDKKKTLAVKLKRFGESLRFPRELRTNRWRLYYMPEDLVRLLHEDVMAAVSEEELFSDISDSYDEADTLDPLGQTLYSDYSTVADFYLRRNDLNRSLGLETRYPFFDVKLVELCARVPSRLKIKGWFDTKYIMKKAVEPWLPKEIVYRKDKLGHSIPLKNWIRDHPYVQEFVGDLLSQDRLRRRGIVNPKFVKKMWDDHMAMTVNNSHRLWSLAVLELWLDRHSDNLAPATLAR
jgi:asparagine synthase (glutamine-hydrolysing)